MYKVLLVDDERIILEGISKVMNWGALGTVLIDTARNGMEAYEKILQHQPHIVISDIKMPGMDGIALISKVKAEFPSIQFILLSGFNEVDYARSAMQYGVKHYLLKPCNENKITESLLDIIIQIKEKEQNDQFILNLNKRFEKSQPYMQEQLLKEFLTNKFFSNKDLSYYQNLFHIEIGMQRVRLILFQLEGVFHYEHLFAIKNIGEETFNNLLLNTNIGEYALFLMVDDVKEELLNQQINQIRERIYQYYRIDTTVAVSEADSIRNARRLYQETLECFNHRFYLGEGTIITKKDISYDNQITSLEMEYDEQALCLLIKSGHCTDVSCEVLKFFVKLANMRLEMNLTKSRVIQLFLSIVQTCDSVQMPAYLEKITTLMNMDRIQQMQAFIEEVFIGITNEYYHRHKTKHSVTINQVIGIIHNHLGNPDLSLKWVANHVLYMNADYLGKLFKQETGERFSVYLTKVRVESAIEQIKNMGDLKMVTLAERLGFGDNSQYFSQVFKKHTGYSPSEYRKAF